MDHRRNIDLEILKEAVDAFTSTAVYSEIENIDTDDRNKVKHLYLEIGLLNTLDTSHSFPKKVTCFNL